MRVSATELKMNMGKYVDRAAVEDIIITRNGKDVALLTNVNNKRKAALKSLRGIIKGTELTCVQIREARIGRFSEGIN